MIPWTFLLRYLPHLIAVLAVASVVFLIRQSGVNAEATSRDLKETQQQLEAATARTASMQQSLDDYQQRVLETQRLAEKRAVTNTVIKTITKEVIREVKVLVPADAPPLPGGWRLLHDAAAQGAPADTSPASRADAAPVPAQDAAAVVVENYGQYHELANDFLLLQEWVTKECK